MIGKKISPILEEIENTLWEFEANNGVRPEFTDVGFRAATKIFMAALMDRMWILQQEEGMDTPTRLVMVQKAGEDVRQLVKTYTNIDTHDLYKLNA